MRAELSTPPQGPFVGGPESDDFQLPLTDPVPPQGAAITFAYNVPDALEKDQDIIRSEMMFFNTPVTEKYAEQVYGVVKNVQAQCSADYQRICPKSAPFMNLNRLMAQLMMPMEDQRVYRGRRLMSTEIKTGADYVNYLRSYYSPLRFIKHLHPLSAVVHLDEKTGNLVGHGKKDADANANRAHHNQPIGEGREGRLAAPGWKMPVEKPKAAKEGAKEEVREAEAPVAALSAVPRSHAAVAPAHGHHHNHGRNLRLAAPGWSAPTPSASASVSSAAIASAVTDDFQTVAEPEVRSDAVGPVEGGKAPCAKPFQPASSTSSSVSSFLERFFAPQPAAQEESTEALVPELTETVPGAGADAGRAADFRSFVLDFLSGRDVSLSLVLPYTVLLDSNSEGAIYLDVQQEQGEGGDYDGYYSYYASDVADPTYYDDDGANYAYDDAAGLDDEADEGAGEEELGGDAGAEDDDFFADRFDLPAMRRPASQSGQPQIIECGGAAGGLTQLARRPLGPSIQPRLQLPRVRGSLFALGGSSEEEDHDQDEKGSSEEEEEGDKRGHDHEHKGPGAGGSSSSEEVGDRHRHPHKQAHGLSAALGRLAAPRHHGRMGRSPSEEHEDDNHHKHHDRDHGPPPPSPRGPPHGPPPPPPHGPVPEDHSFSGNLGFGADGDMCLYRGMAQGRVSQACQGAVGELYELRAQYWEESQQEHHPHGGLGLLIIGLVLLVCCVRRFYAVRYEKKVRSLLTALHTHPHLKASVEAETGIEVPAPVPAGTCCVGARRTTDGNHQENVMARVCKMAVFASLIFAVSFAVSYSALEITMHIVNEMDKAGETDDSGEGHFTSPLAALSILFVVCVAELTLLALVVRGVKALVMKLRASDESSGTGGEPSAPLDTSSHSSHGGARWSRGAGNLSQSAQQVWLSLPTANFFGRGRRFGSGAPRGSEGYTVLQAEEEGEEMGRSAHGPGRAHGTEMVSVNMSAYPARYTPPSAAPAAAVSAPQQHQHHHQQQAVQYAYMPAGPVTARPVNGVTMV